MRRRRGDNGFEVTWSVEDGYVGKDRPQTLYIDESDIDSEMDDDELKKMFWDSIDDDFNQKISSYSRDESAFLDWAHTVIEAQKVEEEETEDEEESE